MKPLILICVTVVCSLSTSLRAQQQNVALGRPVMASGSTWSGQPPGNLTDGDVATMSHPQAKNGTGGFYYEIDLGKEYDLEEIVVFNRSNCCPERLTRYRISIHAADDTNRKTPNWSTILRADGTNSGKGGRDNVDAKLDPQGKFSGRFIRIINTSGAEYNPQVAEVEAWMDSGERSGGVTLHPAHGF